MDSPLSCAGIRPNRQNRSCPHGRASSIQPSSAAAYIFAKARISCRSLIGSTPANRYAALRAARNDIAFGLAHADMHSNVSTLKSRICGSSDVVKISFMAWARSSPFGAVSLSLQHVEQMNIVWRNCLSFAVGSAAVNSTSAPLMRKQAVAHPANDSAYLIHYNPLNLIERNA